MRKARSNKARRVMRHIRVRQRLSGSSGRPRLSIYRSLNHVYAQVIDDVKRVTLVSASSLETSVRSESNIKKTDVSKIVGALVAQRARKMGITTVIFDRGGYRYHGRVKALAEAARKEGLVF